MLEFSIKFNVIAILRNLRFHCLFLNVFELIILVLPCGLYGINCNQNQGSKTKIQSAQTLQRNYKIFVINLLMD